VIPATRATAQAQYTGYSRERAFGLANNTERRVLSPDAAWQRLFWMQAVVAGEPSVARAVRSLSLYDQLELTLQLLAQEWPEPEPLPANVIPFRRRVSQ
jgi:hypothetical protein